jgi:hypothetical protein
MTDVNKSGDSSPISPADRKMYEQEYKRGADLFQKTLDQYTQSTNPFQKEEYKDVMNKAMDVLNQAAAALKKQDLLKQNQKIAQDFATFQKSEDSDKLKTDLDKAKKSIS